MNSGTCWYLGAMANMFARKFNLDAKNMSVGGQLGGVIPTGIHTIRLTHSYLPELPLVLTNALREIYC